MIQLAFFSIETRGLFLQSFLLPRDQPPTSLSHSRKPFLLHRLFTSSNLNQPHTISLCGFLLSLPSASSPTICASGYSHHLRDNKTAKRCPFDITTLCPNCSLAASHGIPMTPLSVRNSRSLAKSKKPLWSRTEIQAVAVDSALFVSRKRLKLMLPSVR